MIYELCPRGRSIRHPALAPKAGVNCSRSLEGRTITRYDSRLGSSNVIITSVAVYGDWRIRKLTITSKAMCGRVIQSSGPLQYAIVDGMNVRDSRVHNYPLRWNAAPSQELLVIRRNHRTGGVSLDPLRWELIPNWCNDPTGGRKPINAKCETVRDLPSFREAYRTRRCIVPVDGFFEWKAIKGQRAKQPYAIAMKDSSPFGLAGIWENWKELTSGESIRTFAIITTNSNELVADIHDRMPVILAPGDYDRWLGPEPDPRDLMRPFPPEPMRMWPISTRVNKPENDDASIVEPIEPATDAA